MTRNGHTLTNCRRSEEIIARRRCYFRPGSKIRLDDQHFSLAAGAANFQWLQSKKFQWVHGNQTILEGETMIISRIIGGQAHGKRKHVGF